MKINVMGHNYVTKAGEEEKMKQKSYGLCGLSSSVEGPLGDKSSIYLFLIYLLPSILLKLKL